MALWFAVGPWSPLIEASRSHSLGDLYLTTRNTHKTQTSMPSAGFEPTVPASERPQTHALDRATTGIGGIPAQKSVSHCHFVHHDPGLIGGFPGNRPATNRLSHGHDPLDARSPGRQCTVIPRLTKTVCSEITFVSRNVISRRFL